MRTLVIQTSFLGDTILTTPLLSALAERGPVDIVTTPAAAGVLAHHPAVRELIAWDKRGADSGARGFLRLAKRLRARRYEQALMAQGSMRSSALALAAGIPRRVGFDTSSGRRLYTTRIPFREDLHHAARLWQLGAAPGAEPSAAAIVPRLHPGDAERDAVDLLLAGRARTGVPLVALAPGSVWATKRWPFYSGLAQLLASRVTLVIIGGPDDAPLAELVLGAAPRAIDATGRLSLLASAELIRRCAVIVTNDSSPLHLASAMGTPTVAVFGPTVPQFGFGPLAPESQVVEHPALACRPCDRHGPQRCPLGHWRCMRELDAAAVAARVERILTERA
ncbi:MAG: glycosyl transferase family 9 [Gemmatimonadetes bacterium]|nr:glycosyl transferase family 9 [Gemmatimonadota bacterium]